jgi:hypothetical protein
MSIQNSYVHSHAHTEGSMIEGYYAKEVIKACQDYLWIEDRCTLGLSITHPRGRLAEKVARVENIHRQGTHKSRRSTL